MDVVRLNNNNQPTKMEHGEIVKGLTDKLWVERYAKNGECAFSAPARTNIREILPIGCFVTHTDSEEVMMIRDHEVSGKKGEDIIIKATGETFETEMAERIVGGNQKFPVVDIQPVHHDNSFSWNHIVKLIQDHTDPARVIDPGDAIPYLKAKSEVSPVPVGSVLFPADFPRGTVYEHILNLLTIDNCGIKCVRPGRLDPESTTMVVYKGVDRSRELAFSYSTGEIEDISYLYSNRKLKNAALVSGTFVEFAVVPPETGYARRWMFVSAPELDQDLIEPPEPGWGLDLINLVLWLRGVEELKKQTDVALKRADVSQDSVQFRYRKDYNLGDLVSVSGGYLIGDNEPNKMRILEYVETEDENGQHSYPTLDFDPV
jgi:hypothetical protein